MTVLRSASGGSGNAHVPEYATDPLTPSPGDIWVLRSVAGAVGAGKIKAFMGLGFPYISVGAGGATTYKLSYETESDGIKRVTIS